MDKRLFDKSSNFFKKEGFYVILFVCLCIVATVAAITARNNRAGKNQPPVVQGPQGNKNNDAATKSGNDKDNPDELGANEPTPSSAINVPKDGASSAVSNPVDTKFAKPVDGTLGRAYPSDSDNIVYCSTIGTYKTNNGIEIKAAVGKPVFAVLDGKVEKVFNDGTELGQYVVIYHPAVGVRTTYANLDTEVNVKEGQTVKKGTQIGKVGKTRLSYSEESFGDHLHFEVQKGNTYVDPARYVDYKLDQK